MAPRARRRDRGVCPALIVVGSTGTRRSPRAAPAAAARRDAAHRARRSRARVDGTRSRRASAPIGDAAELAARYVIGPGAIADVVAEAARYARGGGACRSIATRSRARSARRLSLRLGTYGTVVSRKARMGELVLPDDVIDTLRDMIAMVRERAQILERWGYQRHLGISRGVAALFSGEPGTGKTMAASVVASRARPRARAHRSRRAVVSKYVGETEKNLGEDLRRGAGRARDAAVRRGRLAVRQAHRAEERAGSVREPRGQLHPAAHGDVRRRQRADDERRERDRSRAPAPPQLPHPVPRARGRGAREAVAPAAAAGDRARTTASTSTRSPSGST